MKYPLHDDDVGRPFLLGISFLISLTASAVALATDTTDKKSPWLAFFLILVTVTSFNQRWWWGLYNALMVGLFFNFFFEPNVREISFDSAYEIRTQLAFFVVALISLWVRYGIAQLLRTQSQKTGMSDGADLTWKTRSSAPAKDDKTKEGPWTSG